MTQKFHCWPSLKRNFVMWLQSKRQIRGMPQREKVREAKRIRMGRGSQVMVPLVAPTQRAATTHVSRSVFNNFPPSRYFFFFCSQFGEKFSRPDDDRQCLRPMKYTHPRRLHCAAQAIRAR